MGGLCVCVTVCVTACVWVTTSGCLSCHLRVEARTFHGVLLKEIRFYQGWQWWPTPLRYPIRNSSPVQQCPPCVLPSVPTGQCRLIFLLTGAIHRP